MLISRAPQTDLDAERARIARVVDNLRNLKNKLQSPPMELAPQEEPASSESVCEEEREFTDSQLEGMESPCVTKMEPALSEQPVSEQPAVELAVEPLYLQPGSDVPVPMWLAQWAAAVDVNLEDAGLTLPDTATAISPFVSGGEHIAQSLADVSLADGTPVIPIDISQPYIPTLRTRAK